MSAPDTRVGLRSAKARVPASGGARRRLLARAPRSWIGVVTHAFSRVIGTTVDTAGLAAVCRREAVGSPPRPWRRSRSSLEPSDARLDSLPVKHLKASL